MLLPVLAKFQYLEDLELAENELTTMPADLSYLKTINSLNLSENRFSNLKQVVNSLKALSALRKLSITTKSVDDFNFVTSSLPSLLYLNDQRKSCAHKNIELTRDLKKPPYGNESSPLVERASKAAPKNQIRECDLNDLQSIINSIKKKAEEADKKGISSIISEYEARFAIVSAELNETHCDDTLLPCIKNAMSLKAKYALLDFCCGKMLSMPASAGDQLLWTKIKAGQDQVVEGLLSILIGLQPELEKDVTGWKAKCTKLQGEMSEVLEVSQKLQEDVNKLRNENGELQERFGKERVELREKVAELEADNKKYLGTIVKQSKGMSGNVQKTGQTGSTDILSISFQEIKPVLFASQYNNRKKA